MLSKNYYTEFIEFGDDIRPGLSGSVYSNINGRSFFLLRNMINPDLEVEGFSFELNGREIPIKTHRTSDGEQYIEVYQQGFPDSEDKGRIEEVQSANKLVKLLLGLD